MVKISIKKDKKTKTKAKPRQKQKQKQSQKVIVNIGSKARRGSTLQKKPANNQTPTPNIIVPQAMPQNSNNEILRYIRESEQQKETIKKKEIKRQEILDEISDDETPIENVKIPVKKEPNLKVKTNKTLYFD